MYIYHNINNCIILLEISVMVIQSTRTKKNLEGDERLTNFDQPQFTIEAYQVEITFIFFIIIVDRTIWMYFLAHIFRNNYNYIIN